MADVSVRATLEGFKEVDAALRQTSKGIQSVTDAQTASLQASFKYAEAWTRQHQPMQAASADIQKILGQYDPLGAKLRQLQSDFANLDKAIASGATAGTPEAALDKTMRALNEEITRTKGLMDVAGAATTATSTSMASLGLNTRRAQQELMMLGREALSGHFAQMPMTFTRLVMHTNLWRAILNPVTIGVTALAAAVGVLTYGFIAGRKEMEEMNKAIAITGNFAGVTRGEIVSLAESVSKAGTITIGTAKDIVTQIVASGRYSAENVGAMSRMVENYARLSGEEADKVTPQLIKMFEDPAKAAEELNKKYHTLSVEELERIRTLQRTGQAQEAVTAAMKVIPDVMPEYIRNVGLMEYAWDRIVKKLGEAVGAIKSVGTITPPEIQMRATQAEIDKIIAVNKKLNPDYDPEKDPRIKMRREELKNLQIAVIADQEIKKLQTDVTNENAKQVEAQKLVHQTLQYQNKELKDRLTLAADIKDPVERVQTENKLRKEIADNERAQYATTKAVLEARMAGEEKLLELRVKGAESAIDAELKLGLTTQINADRRKAILELEKNYQLQLNTQKQLQDRTLAPDARQTLEYKLKQQQAEFQISAAQLGQTEQIAEQVRLDKEAETVYKQITENLDQMTTVLNKQGEAQRSLNISVSKQIEEEQFKFSLIGKTIAEQQVLTALHKLDLEYRAAGKELSGEMYEQARFELIGAVKDNANASKEVNQFWKTAAKDMQRSMSSFFFDVMQGNLSDLVGNFKTTIDRMVANALAAKAQLALFGPDFATPGSTAPVGGLVGQGLGWLGGVFGFGGGGSTASMAAAAGNSGALEGALLGAFASGGSFTVGGAGGTDSQTVGFKATPGERVTVETPGQQRSRGGINFNGPLVAVYANDPSAFNRSRGQMGAEMFVLAENFARRFR